MKRASKYLSCVRAFEEVTSKRLHVSTFHRYRLRGLRGVRLRTWLIGGRRMTTTAAVQEFLDAVADAESGNAVPLQSSQKLQRAHQASVQRAEQILEDAGI